MAPEQSWISPKIELRSSTINGRGMFAVEPIKEGEIVLIWGGQYTDKVNALRERALGKLILQWDDNLYSVEERGASARRASSFLKMASSTKATPKDASHHFIGLMPVLHKAWAKKQASRFSSGAVAGVSATE